MNYRGFTKMDQRCVRRLSSLQIVFSVHLIFFTLADPLNLKGSWLVVAASCINIGIDRSRKKLENGKNCLKLSVV